MTTELWMLVAATGITMLAIMAQATHLMIAFSPADTMGTRDNLETTPMAARLQRNVRNHLEGIVLFIPLVVAVSLVGASVGEGSVAWGTTGLSAMGAQIFVASRLVHLVTYAAGIPVVRSLAWMAGLAGLAMMVAALF